MHYPLKMQFKVLALATQVQISDAGGAPVMYVRQKLLKLKEHVEVFRDDSRQQRLFNIHADRMLDFSANYSFTSADGVPWGAVRRRGIRSLWRAHYEVFQDDQVDMMIQEDKPWKKVVESVLGQIPVLGGFIYYLLNPSYTVARPDGTPVMRVVKKPSFFERRFIIEKLTEIPADDELRALLALLMMAILEQDRG